MRRPRCLDLFCGAGGAGIGLHRAGFDVTGVDIVARKYPFGFIQADALTVPLEGYDFIWASPPCQAHTALRSMHNAKQHADLIPETRARLSARGGLWCMENVPGSPLAVSLLLCGTMFGLGAASAELRRHRHFELSGFGIDQPQCKHTKSPVIGIYGGHVRNRKRTSAGARGSQDFRQWHAVEALGLDGEPGGNWWSLNDLSQAIPPAYSEFIGRAALAHLSSLRVAA